MGIKLFVYCKYIAQNLKFFLSPLTTVFKHHIKDNLEGLKTAPCTRCTPPFCQIYMSQRNSEMGAGGPLGWHLGSHQGRQCWGPGRLLHPSPRGGLFPWGCLTWPCCSVSALASSPFPPRCPPGLGEGVCGHLTSRLFINQNHRPVLSSVTSCRSLLSAENSTLQAGAEGQEGHREKPKAAVWIFLI